MYATASNYYSLSGEDAHKFLLDVVLQQLQTNGLMPGPNYRRRDEFKRQIEVRRLLQCLCSRCVLITETKSFMSLGFTRQRQVF